MKERRVIDIEHDLADEGEGVIFTQRATVMLTQLFLAARLEGIAPLLYVRHIIRLGLALAAERLHQIDPELNTILQLAWCHVPQASQARNSENPIW